LSSNAARAVRAAAGDWFESRERRRVFPALAVLLPVVLCGDSRRNSARAIEVARWPTIARNHPLPMQTRAAWPGIQFAARSSARRASRYAELTACTG